ncbi:DUF4865 family protein [Lactobacillus sp. DCY120]|uniref:DUF4865 family protein n=1 Tax=Bombilactobacillus apium TaxID=2675299 RepID=A0A850RBJ5_9LACO|nr:DUF4865 family protein [Bombilactobacillus apium]NVY96168.1 DUF4865 family protein [Bombilactobacillus apium]
MQAMQYQVTLPTDYDMQIIRDRTTNNGCKTDLFPGLLFKAYLITERKEGAISNSYAPFYVWQDSEGMNKFIFSGFFDNILKSFGWQQIGIGITSTVDLSPDFLRSKYLVEEYQPIEPQLSLTKVPITAQRKANELGKVLIYNPDKWQLVTFTFLEDKPLSGQKVYEILHISPGKNLNSWQK